ncbi:MAG: adenosine deaminase [Candidatus Paceibacteria bacterium]|jgi:adenosine deaminase
MESAKQPSFEIIQSLPKVLLHEHLDGGLRPQTVLDLAAEIGYDGLPEKDPEALGAWFFAGADRGSLPEYLEGFRHTIAVMQTTSALERVAYEFIEDMAQDNVVYAEVRFAPHFHVQKGLGLDAVMTAVLRGLKRGQNEFDVDFGLIVCAMRHEEAEFSERIAELAVSYANHGCVGFDLAGEEAGHPANHHVSAFQLAKRLNFNITIHAGESFGPESIWQALQYCGAHRIGHGVRLLEDIVVYDRKVIRVGALAQYILDHRVPLEICLSSNVHTGAAKSLEDHPFPYFWSKGYRVTLNTDNRLMSNTTMSKEFEIAVKQYGLTFNDLEKITINGMKSAFTQHENRVRIIFEKIKPGYKKLRQEHDFPARKYPYVE